MKNSFLILGFLISLLISCPPPTPEPGPDEGGNGSGNETAKEFTVSFDPNGGTGAIAPMKVKAGTVITLPDGTAFSRKYYTFNYWTISGLDFYEKNSEYTVKADTVFSAAWSHNQVSITYDSNHEELNFKKEETWVNAGSDLILPGTQFGSSSPAGKYFYGWTTTATATEANILAPGSSFPVEETALTFYAFWGSEKVTEYKVNFSGTEMESITFNQYTEEIRLPLYTGEPGIICKGWDTDEAAANVVYKDGDIIPKEKLTGDIVLYPILEDVRVALTWEKNGNVSPDNSDVFPDRVAPGDFLFMAYAVTKDSGDGKVWILESVTAETVSGKTVPTRKEMMDGIAEVWHISVPAEATVITLNWEELTQLTVSTLTVYNPYEYYSNEKIISFEFLYSANSDPKTENLKITKDGKEVEILSYHYEFYTLEEKIGVCELSAAEGAGNYLLQIVYKGNVEAAFTVENKGERTFTPTAGTPTQNTSGQWVIPVSFVFSNISHPGWLNYNVFLNDAQEELTEYTDYDTTISDTNMDFTFTDSVTIQQGDEIRITFTYDESLPIQTKSVEVTIPTPPVPGPDEGGSGSGDGTKKEFTVSFDTGGGTGTVDPMTAEAGTAITLPSADGLSRQYYTFTAWETGGKQYNPDDEFTVSADTVFTAVWTRNTITVTYEANHESVTPPSHTETVDAGGFFPLLENPFGNSPDGQIFYGWALTQTPQESEILKPNTEYTAGETDITFYAVWETFTEGGDPTTPQTHTVTFNTDGGTGTVDPMTAEAGTAITLPSADGLSRQYYTFTAWETGEKQYNPGDQFTVNANTVFTAVWTRNTITVTYEANHESVTPPSHTEPVDAGGIFRLPENPFDNSPDGQIFYGWALTQTPQGSDILKPNAYSFADEANITFYAVWKSSSEVVFLTWNKNGGETYQEDAFPVAVNQGATVMLEEMYYFKNDGDDPYILTGIKVTETANGTPVNVTKSDGDYSPCWSFQAGTEALTVELLWEIQSIEGYTFDVGYVLYEENYIDMPVYTDIALSPGMITVTNEAGQPVIPSQKTAACAQIQNGMRSHSCFIEFDPNIPAGTYNVIVTVSGQTICTETVTVPEPQP